MATYRALVDLYLPSGAYVQAGSTITDAGLSPDVSAAWPPPIAVDPLDGDAISKFWAVGPRGQADAEPSRLLGPWWTGGRWTGVPISPPLVYWKPHSEGRWVLTGAGAALGPKRPPDVPWQGY